MQEPSSPTALEELESDPASRKRFLGMLGGTAAAGMFSAVLAACGASSSSDSSTTSANEKDQPSAAGDIKILNYALTLEYVESDFYKRVDGASVFSGQQAELVRGFGRQEDEHVDALTALVRKLGGKPAARPQTHFDLNGAQATARLAASVENLGAAAYLGQVARIRSKEVLAAALSIHSVEARHAAALNEIVGQPPTPGPFARAASMDEVLAKVRPYIVS
jgi:rubrerythrin